MRNENSADELACVLSSCTEAAVQSVWGIVLQTFVGVTDYDWFRFLRPQQPDEVNFWQPRTRFRFHALKPGGLFLFKLKAPRNAIVGGGWFVRQAFLPASLAWDAFGLNNGRRNFDDFLSAIYDLRGTDRLTEPDPVISSLVLAEPFFLPESHMCM